MDRFSRMWRKLQKSAVCFLLIFVAVNVWAADFPGSPNPFRYVNDYTNTLSENDKNYLENKLINFSRETSSQIAVVMVKTTGEYAISDYAFTLGDNWGIGRKQLNNGVLLLVAKEDRKVFIATGQGLEGALPDAFLSQIIRRVILPNFRQEQYASGINGALDYIIAASKGEYDAAAEQNDEGFEQYIPFLMVLVFVLFVLFGELNGRRKPYISPTTNHQLEQVILQSARRRRGNSGGFGSGGFGGFGGGGSSGGGFGGGGFGGGGAGGSW